MLTNKITFMDWVITGFIIALTSASIAIGIRIALALYAAVMGG